MSAWVAANSRARQQLTASAGQSGQLLHREHKTGGTADKPGGRQSELLKPHLQVLHLHLQLVHRGRNLPIRVLHR